MMLTPEQENIMKAAELGYEAYSDYTGGRSLVTGDLLPMWKDLPGEIKNAWFAAATSIFTFLTCK